MDAVRSLFGMRIPGNDLQRTDRRKHLLMPFPVHIENRTTVFPDKNKMIPSAGDELDSVDVGIPVVADVRPQGNRRDTKGTRLRSPDASAAGSPKKESAIAEGRTFSQTPSSTPVCTTGKDSPSQDSDFPSGNIGDVFCFRNESECPIPGFRPCIPEFRGYPHSDPPIARSGRTECSNGRENSTSPKRVHEELARKRSGKRNRFMVYIPPVCLFFTVVPSHGKATGQMTELRLYAVS